MSRLVRFAFAPLEDAARLSLESRRDEQLGRARRVWAFANSLEINGNALSLESALHDLSFDPRLSPEHRYEVFSHMSIMSPCVATFASIRPRLHHTRPRGMRSLVASCRWCRHHRADGDSRAGAKCPSLAGASSAASPAIRLSRFLASAVAITRASTLDAFGRSEREAL